MLEPEQLGMDRRQAADDKYLFYQSQIEQDQNLEKPLLHTGDKLCFWTERFALIRQESPGEFWQFTIFDFFTNESRPIRYRKRSTDNIRLPHFWFFPLDGKYGFIIECMRDIDWYISLCKLDLLAGEFKKVEKFVTRGVIYFDILVDRINPLKLVLVLRNNFTYTYLECKLVNCKVEITNSYHSVQNFWFYCHDKLLGEGWAPDLDDNLEHFEIPVYDLIKKEERSIEIEALPNDVYYDHNSTYIAEWIYERICIVIRHRDNNDFGLAMADLNSKRWTIVDFATELKIRDIYFLNGSLNVHAYDQPERDDGIFESKQKFYKIQVRHPSSLRELSWHLNVKLMKSKIEQERLETDPIAAVNAFLPFNTDLRSPWFEEDENDE